jgi:hypothetical protein
MQADKMLLGMHVSAEWCAEMLCMRQVAVFVAGAMKQVVLQLAELRCQCQIGQVPLQQGSSWQTICSCIAAVG